MKTRLLPPQVDEDPAPYDGRRDSDRCSVKVAAAESIAEPQPVEEPRPSVVRTTPQVSRRPSGRGFVAAILLAMLIGGAYSVWNAFFRFTAVGIVSGQIINVSPPWPATMQTLYVRGGDAVRQGDVVARLFDPELDAEIDRLGDQLRSAQADLVAKTALLAVEARHRQNQAQEVEADYFDMKGRLLAEQSRLADIAGKLTRWKEMANVGAVSEEELQSLGHTEQGLRSKVEHLQEAVDSLSERLKVGADDASDSSRLAPAIAKIEHVQAEIGRLREKKQRAVVRAPVGGRVVAVAQHVGERVDPRAPMLEILQDGTVEIVVFVRQDQTEGFQAGQFVRVLVDPAALEIVCKIDRVGERYELLPRQLRRREHYVENLLPIYLKPPTVLPDGLTLRVGSTVRLTTTGRVTEGE